MATYVNDLRLKEIATGDESGTWGASTNTNLELIAEAFSYGTEASFGSDADATTTIADGATDPARSLYFKVTSGVSLTATRTLTLAPNDVSKVWIIENATSGSQSINISQGSGSNVTIGNGDVKIVYSDGGGASANVVDAFTDLSVTDKFKIEGSTPTLTIGDGGEEDTKLVFDGNAKDFYVGLDDSADKLVIGEGSTVGTNSIVTLTDDSVTIGDGAEVDTKIVFDGNAQDFYIGLDDSADDLIIGSGSAVGTTPAITIDENQDVTITQDLTVSSNTGLGSTHDLGANTHIKTADSGVSAVNGNADDLVIENADFTGISILGENETSIFFGDNEDSDVGRIEYAHSTNVMKFRTNASDSMIIDSSGNVGIGTSSPDDLLHVFAGDSTASASTLSAVNIEKNDDVALTFMTPNNKKAQIRFADPQDSGNGIITYDHDTASMQFATNGPEKMRITSAGNVGIGDEAPGEKLSVTSGDNTSSTNIARFAANNDSLAIGIGYESIRQTESGGVIKFETEGSERMRLDSTGPLLFGMTSKTTASTNGGVYINGDYAVGATNYYAQMFMQHNVSNNHGFVIKALGSSGIPLAFQNSSGTLVGSVTTNVNSTTYSTSSDHRLKENVVDMTGAITRVKQLQPRRFNFIADADTTVDGFVAHEASTVVPEAVTGTHNETRTAENAVLSADGSVFADGVTEDEWTAGKTGDNPKFPSDSTWTASHTFPVYQGIDQAKLVPLLTGALQEAIAKIESLETRIETLENA
jgi:hypothetical protein